MDGCGHALDMLLQTQDASVGLHVVLFEVCPHCQHLLLNQRTSTTRVLSTEPDQAGLRGSVFAATEHDGLLLTQFLDLCTGLLSVLVVGGSPCVGFSRARARPTGTRDPESCKLWALPWLAAKCRAHLADRADAPQVCFLVENVVMDAAFSSPISTVLGVSALLREAGDVGACDRPRLFWTNLQTTTPQRREVDPAECLRPGWRPAWELTGASCRPRFRTFLRPFGPGRPREFPKPWPRLPLSAYDDRGLVYAKGASSADLERARLRHTE